MNPSSMHHLPNPSSTSTTQRNNTNPHHNGHSQGYSSTSINNGGVSSEKQQQFENQHYMSFNPQQMQQRQQEERQTLQPYFSNKTQESLLPTNLVPSQFAPESGKKNAHPSFAQDYEQDASHYSFSSSTEEEFQEKQYGLEHSSTGNQRHKVMRLYHPYKTNGSSAVIVGDAKVHHVSSNTSGKTIQEFSFYDNGGVTIGSEHMHPSSHNKIHQQHTSHIHANRFNEHSFSPMLNSGTCPVHYSPNLPYMPSINDNIKENSHLLEPSIHVAPPSDTTIFLSSLRSMTPSRKESPLTPEINNPIIEGNDLLSRFIPKVPPPSPEILNSLRDSSTTGFQGEPPLSLPTQSSPKVLSTNNNPSIFQQDNLVNPTENISISYPNHIEQVINSLMQSKRDNVTRENNQQQTPNETSSPPNPSAFGPPIVLDLSNLPPSFTQFQPERKSAPRKKKPGSSFINDGPWNEEEHEKFMEGYKAVGQDWKAISENYVKTRTRVQVAAYAAKIFKTKPVN